VGQRLAGFRAALAAARVTPHPELELAVPFEVGATRAAVAALIERKVRFDAVFGCSDLLAISAMQVLREHKREVPHDVAVVGYDDMPVASYCDPPLTSVHQPVPEAGVQLVDALLAMLHGQVAAPRLLPVELVVRRSSMP
jgi:DNA-binding LacI/PurR family transcriptional regulator